MTFGAWIVFALIEIFICGGATGIGYGNVEYRLQDADTLLNYIDLCGKCQRELGEWMKGGRK